MARGSIRPRKGKTGVSYRVTWDAGLDPVTGKRIQRSETVRTKKAAEKLLAEKLAAVHKGDYLEPSRETLRDFLARWFEIRRPRWRESTVLAYEARIRLHILPHLGGLRLREIRRGEIEAWLSTLAADYRRETVAACLRVLKAALGDAAAWEEIPKNPAAGVRAAGAEARPVRVWTLDEAARFLEACAGDPWRPVWWLAIDGGLRRGELMALRWSALDLEAGALRVELTATRTAAGRWVEGEPKSEAGRRVVYLGPAAVKALRLHKAAQNERRLWLGEAWRDEGRVFDRGDGRGITAGMIEHHLERACEAAGVPPINPHGLRHTSIRAAIAAGVTAKAAQERFGHASAALTLDLYGSVEEAARRSIGAQIEDVLRVRDQTVTKTANG